MLDNTCLNEPFYIKYQNKPIRGLYKITHDGLKIQVDNTWQKSQDVTLEQLLTNDYSVLHLNQIYYVPSIYLAIASYDIKQWVGSEYNWRHVDSGIFYTSSYEAILRAERILKNINELPCRKYEPKFNDNYYIPSITTDYVKHTWIGDIQDWKYYEANMVCESVIECYIKLAVMLN